MSEAIERANDAYLPLHPPFRVHNAYAFPSWLERTSAASDGTLVIRVRFDDQIVMHQPRGGVSRYFVELVRELRDDPELGVAVDVDWRASRNEHAVAAGLGRPASRSRRRLNRLARRLPRVRRRIDLVHPTWYYPDRLPAIEWSRRWS